jgi:uncharacterized membrane protein YqaE (UPF0057 family)
VDVVEPIFQNNKTKALLEKSKGNKMNLMRIILGILIPPLGVFLTVGVGATLVINILLTLLGWLPGSIHALWVIVKHEEKVSRASGIEEGKQEGIY